VRNSRNSSVAGKLNMAENPLEQEAQLEEEIEALEKEIEALNAENLAAENRGDEQPAQTPEVTTEPEKSEKIPEQEIIPEIKSEEVKPEKEEGFLFQTNFPSESKAETIRKSGLAYAAAITFFGSIVFMLLLGWFADLLLGTSPWGVVGGIVLGSIIGFVQFFRITSQILKNKD
jgi:F0F1-type ATP synthase assembly protein I